MGQESESEVEYLRLTLSKVFAEGTPLVFAIMQSLLQEAEERGLRVELECGFSEARYKAILSKHCSRLIMMLEGISSNQGLLMLWATADLSQKPEAGEPLGWDSGFATLRGWDKALHIPISLCPFNFDLHFSFKDGEMVLIDG